jgi:hypothetical protein
VRIKFAPYSIAAGCRDGDAQVVPSNSWIHCRLPALRSSSASGQLWGNSSASGQPWATPTCTSQELDLTCEIHLTGFDMCFLKAWLLSVSPVIYRHPYMNAEDPTASNPPVGNSLSHPGFGCRGKKADTAKCCHAL